MSARAGKGKAEDKEEKNAFCLTEQAKKKRL
jgi:hypothetical protein